MTNRRQLSSLLHSEWEHLRRRPSALRIARTWGLVPGRLDDLDQLLAAVGFEMPPTTATENALRRLVAVAATDGLAARVVIQRLLPGLLAVARRRSRVGGDVFDEVLGAAWIAIRTYRPTRHPACIAAALVADADYRAFRKHWRTPSRVELSNDETLFDQLADEPVLSPEQELAQALQAALDTGADRDAVDLLRRLATHGTAEVAAQLSISARTVRNRRLRATRNVSEAVAAA